MRAKIAETNAIEVFNIRSLCIIFSLLLKSFIDHYQNCCWEWSWANFSWKGRHFVNPSSYPCNQEKKGKLLCVKNRVLSVTTICVTTRVKCTKIPDYSFISSHMDHSNVRPPEKPNLKQPEDENGSDPNCGPYREMVQR
ncbi:uncharacterized protein LOC110230716 isoform X1 [Arabidopsis lyrata subsp. lyrata]|uniref:uncharacterized protein LOC110230716 isoform X1 n=1 Tax=Arabidopsis lyrata subsp. lyrata TaxID=81972 RepID=UPI000A29C75A|nr:uncharacterized protein LOC110230716 isoform X1 [Arabidopsis lyrata subsp. lyrata]|eukprot:XP_020889962.1 uncharacterized protein LOC110230716 isoform X1 [Arabidopsis lyrata subsp. lyrata]